METAPLRRKNESVDTRLVTNPSRPRIRKRPTRQSEANKVQVRDELCVTLLKPSHGPIALNEIVLVLKIGELSQLNSNMAYSKLAVAKILNIFIYGFTYLTSNLHGHFVPEYQIYVTK